MIYCHLLRIILFISILFPFVSLCGGAAFSAEKAPKIRRVVIDGNHVYSDNRLRRMMITSVSGVFTKKRFNAVILEEDIAAIEEFYHQNGYLEANITGYAAEIDSSRGLALIRLTLTEGELTTVEGVSVLGNTAFPDSVLMKYIKVAVDKPFRSLQVEASTMALITLYADHGYLDAEVNPEIRVDSERHRALVDFTIREKAQCRIGKIRIQGLEKTRRTVVNREFLFEEGEVVDYSRLLESQRSIYMTGLFQSVFIRPQIAADGDSTVRDIIVEMRENMSGEFNIAGGYGAIDKARGKIEIFNNNLRGTALKLGLIGRISHVQRGVETSFTNPWTFNSPWRTDLNVYTEWKSETGYDFDRFGGKLTFGRKIRANAYTMTWRNEHVRLGNVETSEIPDKLKSDTRSLKMSVIRDTRDNLFDTAKGQYYELSGEFGAFFTTTSYGFFRLTGQAKRFFPIGSTTVAATSFDVGFINARRGYAVIPLQERYYIGGPNSLRGFAYEKAGLLDDKGVPAGGTVKIVWNIIEIRRDIYKMFGAAVFADAGGVWANAADISLSNVRWDIGYGFRLNTPVGLARLDYGFNIDRDKGEKARQVFFSMGQAF